MDNPAITSDRIPVEQLLSWKNHKVKPIDGINIPNITVPAILASKKRATEAADNVVINIRLLFNSITADNVTEIREQLREIVHAKAHKVEMLEEIASEILQNFIISDKNIKNYMQLLNAIWKASILLTNNNPNAEKTVSPSIGNYFLNNCKNLIFDLISRDNIKKLAEMDLEDSDQLDIYHRERDKIINLIITICCLYEQRTTALIKLSANHLYTVIKFILDTYQVLQKQMKDLGDPMTGDCQDEQEYETIRKMCSLYAEQIYTFMAREGKDFLEDKTVVKDKTLGDQYMQNLVERFKKEVVPTLTEAFLISKCESLNI